MLEDGELVGLVAHIVEEAIDELGGHRCAEEAGGTLNCLAALRTCEARDQVLTAVEGFRQTAELLAVADEVGSHAENDVAESSCLGLREEEGYRRW
jgi:hypothetical protein